MGVEYENMYMVREMDPEDIETEVFQWLCTLASGEPAAGVSSGYRQLWVAH